MAERNRGKQRRSDSRDRRDRNRGGGGKNGGGGDHHHRLGGDSGGAGGGGASGAGVAEGAAEGATLVQQSGQLAAAMAEATEGGGMAREDVQHETACQSPPARLLPRARATARWPWSRARGVKSHRAGGHLGLGLSRSCCVC